MSSTHGDVYLTTQEERYIRTGGHHLNRKGTIDIRNRVCPYANLTSTSGYKLTSYLWLYILKPCTSITGIYSLTVSTP